MLLGRKTTTNKQTLVHEYIQVLQYIFKPDNGGTQVVVCAQEPAAAGKETGHEKQSKGNSSSWLS